VTAVGVADDDDLPPPLTVREQAAADELERVGEDGAMAIAYAILRLAHAMESIAFHLKHAGTGEAVSPAAELEAFDLVMRRLRERFPGENAA